MLKINNSIFYLEETRTESSVVGHAPMPLELAPNMGAGQALSSNTVSVIGVVHLNLVGIAAADTRWFRYPEGASRGLSLCLMRAMADAAFP